MTNAEKGQIWERLLHSATDAPILSKTMNLQEQEGWKNQERAYEQGLLAGYTKSIVLIRHLQRTLSPNENITPKSEDRVKATHQRKILEEAMELISKNIK